MNINIGLHEKHAVVASTGFGDSRLYFKQKQHKDCYTSCFWSIGGDFSIC